MTANATKEDRENCKSAGMDDYLSKPVCPEELFAVLVKYLKDAEISDRTDESACREKQISAVSDLPSVSCSDIFSRKEFLHRIGGNAELFAELVREIPMYLSEEIAKLKNAVQENNADAIRLHAHSLKGLCANSSAHRLRNIALRIETAFKEGYTEQMNSLTGELDQEFALFQSVLSDITG